MAFCCWSSKSSADVCTSTRSWCFTERGAACGLRRSRVQIAMYRRARHRSLQRYKDSFRRLDPGGEIRASCSLSLVQQLTCGSQLVVMPREEDPCPQQGLACRFEWLIAPRLQRGKHGGILLERRQQPLKDAANGLRLFGRPACVTMGQLGNSGYDQGFPATTSP